MIDKLGKVIMTLFTIFVVSTTEVKAEGVESLEVETEIVEDSKDKGKLYLPGDTRNLKVYTKLKGDTSTLGRLRVRYRVVIKNPEDNDLDIIVNKLNYVEDSIEGDKRVLVTDYQEYSKEEKEMMDIEIELKEEILNKSKNLNLDLKVMMEVEEYETKKIVASTDNNFKIDLGSSEAVIHDVEGSGSNDRFKQTGSEILGLSIIVGISIMYAGHKIINREDEFVKN